MYRVTKTKKADGTLISTQLIEEEDLEDNIRKLLKPNSMMKAVTLTLDGDVVRSRYEVANAHTVG